MININYEKVYTTKNYGNYKIIILYIKQKIILKMYNNQIILNN